MTSQTSNRLVSQEKIDFYHENGFVQIDDVLTPEEIAELAETMDEAMQIEEGLGQKTDRKNGNYYRVLNQKVNTWRDHGGMAKFSFHPKLARIAMELSQWEGVRLFHDHALWKMPEDSKPTPWHQDFPYWPMTEPGALSAWIPVQDVDEHNGCMMFVPGSHKIGKLTGISLSDPQDIFEYVKDTDIANRKPVKVPLKAGSCTFHNGLTFHYGHANMSDKPRRVLANIYMRDGTTYNGKSHICTNGLNLQENEPLRGGLFPLVARV
jgi:ectoine hydroxylase-related dioxygenase (phytanoyl-CoA dioxygenase family)